MFSSSFVCENFDFTFVARLLLFTTEAEAFHIATGRVLCSVLTMGSRRLLRDEVVVLINNVNGDVVQCFRSACGVDVLLDMFGGSLLKGRVDVADIVIKFSHWIGFLAALRLLTCLVFNSASVGQEFIILDVYRSLKFVICH